jgi:hypothetical protein
MRRRAIEAELGRRLREAPVPLDRDADTRVLGLALAQQAGRRPTRRSPLPRLAVALAVALALGALLLTPAWAAVRDWVGDAFQTATPVRAPQTGLGKVPGGGRLLVRTEAGSWVVEPDGADHLLRGYREASWSPHGLFLAAIRGDHLVAVEPGGHVHWALRAAGPIEDPRWSPSGELIAYRSGGGIRVVAGDGSEDRPLDESVRPVAPAWDPGGRPDLAYVDARGALRVLDAATGRASATATALPGIRTLEWAEADIKPAAGNAVLLEASARRVRVRATALGASHEQLLHPRELSIPPGETVRAAALSPDGRSVAALLARRADTAPRAARTDLVVFSIATGAARRLGSVPGRLTEVAWSPRGNRLLVAWPSFDEWLFVPLHFAKGTAMTGIAAAFDTGGSAPFPSVSGWCCRARSGATP